LFFGHLNNVIPAKAGIQFCRVGSLPNGTK